MALRRGLSNQERVSTLFAATGLSTTTGQLVGAASFIHALVISDETGAGVSAQYTFTDQTAAGAVTGNVDTVLRVHITTADNDKIKKIDFVPALFVTNNLRVSVIGSGTVAALYNPAT